MDKIVDLKSVVGRDGSCNYSPTHRSKLIRVGKELCILEVTQAQHGDLSRGIDSVGVQFTLPISIVHNMYFF